MVVLGFTAIAFSADAPVQSFAAHGRLIITQFVSAPFPHASRTNGHAYKNVHYPADKHYSDSSVALFIPKSFRETKRVDFIVHFHGWGNTVTGTLEQFKLIEQLTASGRNAVLIVPEGPRDAPDSGGGKLEEAGGFARFMDEAVATLKQRGVFKQKDWSPGGIILSGHSGGYRVMSAIVERGGVTERIKEVWLFDALYAETDKFLAWSDRKQGRLLNIYTDHGGTKDDSERMMERLRSRGTVFLATEDSTVTGEQLKTNALVFLHTDLQHNDVVAKRKIFQQFLETSFLERSAVILAAQTDTLDTPTYRITIQGCGEYVVSCDTVKYVGVNKKSGKSIVIVGSTVHAIGADGVTPSSFLGYEFKSGGARYFVSQDGELRVTRGSKVLLEEQGVWK